ncbi:MAG: twin-arginine translocase subunit TatC [Candidatus Alcyoniella australis]|nr:twin-arginine translocase subunit TatC [Candidatus Alcyoniella australis]
MKNDNGPEPDRTRPAPPSEPVPHGDESDPSLDEQDGAGARMPVIDHLTELRTRLLYSVLAFLGAFIGLYYPLRTKVLVFLLQPYLDAYNSLILWGEEKTRSFQEVTTALSPQEVLFTDMKAIALVALIVSSPVIFYQVWLFVRPALKRAELRFTFPFVIASTIFFMAGTAFCYKVILNISSAFLILYAAPVTAVRVSIASYFSFALRLELAFGLAFELPVAIFILARMGLVNAKFLWSKFRWAILVIALCSAVLTPPDIVSQTLLGIPLIGLYVLSIGVAHVFGKSRPAAAKDDDEEDEPPEDEPAG